MVRLTTALILLIVIGPLSSVVGFNKVKTNRTLPYAIYNVLSMIRNYTTAVKQTFVDVIAVLRPTTTTTSTTSTTTLEPPAAGEPAAEAGEAPEPPAAEPEE